MIRNVWDNLTVTLAIVVIAFVFTIFALANQIAAQGLAGQEHIRDFRTDIQIKEDGTIDVTETIVYDFASLSRHGIFRNIPYSKINSEGERVILTFDNFTVTDEAGQEYKFEHSQENFEHILKIGDPNSTITGAHSYAISYTVGGALGYFEDHDELYWNSTGNGWQVPIASASANIIFAPSSTDPIQGVRSACYTGPYGSVATECTSNVQAGSSHIESKRALMPSEGLTVVYGFPKGHVAVLEPEIYVPFWKRWYGRLLAFILFVGATLWYLIVPLLVIRKWWREGRDPKVREGEVTAWYDSPKGQSGRSLTPAETGSLIDERVEMCDISALIVDLARRGHLRIVEKKLKDFYFVRSHPKRREDLLDFEEELLSGIFGTATKEVRIKGSKLYLTIEKVRKKLYQKLVDEGFFVKNPDAVRTKYVILGIVGLTTFNLPVAIVSFIFGRAMPAKTHFGAQQTMIAKSLKNYLGTQKRQLEFQSKHQYWFEKLLPYAVAFGVERVWAGRFKNIELREPEWYSSSHAGRFNSSVFSNSLASSMKSISTAATPPSSSSSSGFSGGSSGGGGGGGGGGSW